MNDVSIYLTSFLNWSYRYALQLWESRNVASKMYSKINNVTKPCLEKSTWYLINKINVHHALNVKMSQALHHWILGKWAFD